ncbi:MAG: ABC transporter ATP-binding protein [Phycisphaerales bacterium]
MIEPAHQHVIDVTGLRYRFPGTEQLALNVPKFVVSHGEHTAILGPSGCGKTTLLRLIVGILIPQSGSIEILGVDPSILSLSERGHARLRSIGMVFQEFALLDYLSALENIVLTARLGGMDLIAAKSRARDLAERVGISHTLRRKPAKLSQGERQRVAICRSLVTNPKLIVCDEPTGNLDPARSREIVDLLIQEAEKIDATVVAVTHDQCVQARFARSIDLGDIASLTGDGR